MESIFVIVSPHSCTASTLQQVRRCLTHGGAQLKAESFVVRDALELHPRQLAVLIGSAHYWAMSPSQQVLPHPLNTANSDISFCAAEDDLKSLFYSHYGELWDAVVAEKRLQTAYDVLRLSGMTVVELEEQCLIAATDTAANNVLKLPTHLTITRIDGAYSSSSNSGGTSRGTAALYVVNGVYPAQHSRFFQASDDHDSFWWCSASLSGPASAQQRQQLFRTVEGLFSSADEVRILTNPLETLAYRVAWMHTPLDRDAFASVVLQRGVPPSWLEMLLRNPTVHDHGHFTTVFDLVDGKSPVEAAVAVAKLWNDVRRSEETPKHSDAVDGAPGLYDWENGYLDFRTFAATAAAAAADVKRTRAVVFLHPRLGAHTDLTSRMQQRLEKQEICVGAVHHVFVEELHAKLDLHFGALARYALDQEALRRLAVYEADTTADFEAAYGVSWQQAMDEGRIWSVSLAQQLLGAEYAQSLLKHCLSEKKSTREFSPSLSITTVARQMLISLNYPKTSLNELFSPVDHNNNSKKEPCRPYSLTPDTFFVVNAAYGVYRHDILNQQVNTNDVAAGVWQLSWEGASGVDPSKLQQLAFGLTHTDEPSEEQVEEASSVQVSREEQIAAAAYHAAVGDVVRHTFPLVHILCDPAAALRARHLWWGTPYDEDALTCQLRAHGQSWVTLFPPLSPFSTEAAEAVLVLPPRVASNQTILLAWAILQENGVTVVEETDLYGAEAVAYVFGGGNSLLAAASALAHRSGAALWASLSKARQNGLLAEIADGIRAAADEFVPPLNAENVIGGATACNTLQITLSTFAEAWTAAQPRRVDRTCWLAFLSEYAVWVVNGHVAVLEQRYSVETSRVHLMRLRWSATSKSWAGMHAALLGKDEKDDDGDSGVNAGSDAESEKEGVSNAGSNGSLTLLLSRAVEKDAQTSKDDPVAVATVAEPLCLLSPTPYDTLIDLLRWPHGASGCPTQSQVALEDWLLLQHYIREQLTGSNGVACSFGSIIEQVRETLSSTATQTAQPHSSCFLSFPSAPQWIPLFTQAQRDAQLHHGFIWLHPSSTTPPVLENFSQLLLEHRVHIRASGMTSLQVATERQLLDTQHAGFYKNAYVRSAAQVPITDAEARAFAMHFHQNWITAVQLGLVLSAHEAEQRFGAVHLMKWLDTLSAEHQAQLSEQLFVGYMAEEGLYVMNPLYSYLRARLYAGGGHVAWYAVEWHSQEMTWPTFMTDVVGDADPASAAPGSLRGHFSANWIRYSLPGQPDAIECVLHASDSPLAALAERCRWLDCRPEDDPYGRVLIQSGVHPALLSLLLSNPTLYMCETGLMSEAFHLLGQEDVHELAAQLRGCACHSGTFVIPDTVPLIPPPAIPETPKQEDDAASAHLDEYPSLVKQLQDYRDVALQQAVNLFRLCSFACPFSTNDVEQNEELDDLHSAILYLDPLDRPAGSRNVTPHALRRFVEQHLNARGVRVVYERLVQCSNEAEATMLYRLQHHRRYRYGIEVPAVETIVSNIDFQVKLKAHFDVSLRNPSIILRNAAEMAEFVRGTGHDVAALWTRAKRLYPRDNLVLSNDCVVQRLHPRKGFFLLNGDAVVAEQQFAAKQSKSGVLVWYLRWNSLGQSGLSYAQLTQIIASMQGPRGPLRACWNTYGWADGATVATTASAAAVDPCLSLHVSESSLAAVRQRQLWLSLPICTDPVVRAWCGSTANSPSAKEAVAVFPLRALGLALQDPLVSLPGEIDETRYLWDTVVGMDALRLQERIHEWWAIKQADASETKRNSAVLALMPQVAANAAVRQLVRNALADNGLRIDEQGFVANHGDTTQVRRSAQCLFPEDWSYATQEPHQLHLTPDECDRVAAVFQSSWAALLNSGRVLPASRATKRLGGMSAAQLQLFVKAAKKALWVRPHLHVAELEEYGVFVVNAHVAHLTDIIVEAAGRLPLPYYVVSWDARQFSSWEECVERLVGNAEPSLASPQSIRGRVNTAWASLGLHAAPVMGESVVDMSEGPVHGLLARLHLRWPAVEALEEDVLGGLLIERAGGAVVVPVLREWLANPQITCDGRSDGALTHLANWDAEEVVNLLARLVKAPPRESVLSLPTNLSSVRQEERDAEGKRAVEAAWRAAVKHRDELPMLLSDVNTTNRDNVDAASKKDASAGSLLPPYRNVGTLLFLSSRLSDVQREQLRRHLQARGVSVAVTAEEEEQEATPELLDRLFATESFFTDCTDVARVLRETNEVAPEDQQRFSTIFRDEVAWPTLLEYSEQRPIVDNSTPIAHPVVDASPGLYSAADAIKRWRWSPHDLWRHVRSGLSMQLTTSIEVTRLSWSCAENEEEEILPYHGQSNEASRSCSDVVGWAGQYVVNGTYAALRDALHSTSPATTQTDDWDDAENQTTAAPLLTMWEVSWDSRTLSWQDFAQRVIGCRNCERAAPGSFNALLREADKLTLEKSEEETALLSSPLSFLGVVPASGPLAAFAVRSHWCRNARNRYNAYIPDPLVRAMAVASVLDPSASLRDSWLTDPLVAKEEERSGSAGSPARCCRRLFDWTRNCDTLQVLHWLSTSHAAAAGKVDNAASPPRTTTADANKTDGKTVDEITECGENDGNDVAPGAPPLPPPRIKTQLNAARVRDALLHARKESDWRRLWDYYGTFDTTLSTNSAIAADTASYKSESTSADTNASTVDTIPFAPFYLDFKSLDTFGVPNVSHELKLLFTDVEVRGRGRMTYAQFTHALSMYHAL